MKLLILLCAQSWHIFLVNSFEQLVKPGYTRAWSSSVDYGGYPNKTVNGDLRQSRYFYCMHTAGDEPEAWLRINLRKIYNINSVKFWYRNDSRIPGYNTRRIQGFNIRLSNTTQRNHQDICYQDDGNKILPPVIEKECEGVAQYVWIYTNRTVYGEVFLEICEVQIFGCSYQDSDGNCISCNQCKNDCNINGECDDQGCKKDGYRPPYCKECKRGNYGLGCNSTCGHCASNVRCDTVTGSCPNRMCAPGWENTKDWRCDEACKPGWYGRRCQEQCGNCSGNKTCHHVNGTCPALCQPGYQQEKCDEPCTNGWYGRECKELCGYCRSDKPCHYVNGSCFGLCEPGYSGEKCVFSQHLANQREMIKLMRELLVYKRRKFELKENLTSPTDFK